MKLIFPEEKYLDSYDEARRENCAHGFTSFRFLNTPKEEILQIVSDSRDGRNLKPGYVKTTHLWLVDGDELIGEVSIRHELTDALRRHSGNIGYWIRPSYWGKGLGTLALLQALDYVRATLPLSRVLITCNDENIASARVIEKNGGVLQDKIINQLGPQRVLTRRYWIEL